MAGNAIDGLARRFPERASAIRRLGARDPNFRAICKDHGLALRALQHWAATNPAAPERVAEYRQSLEELEAEALTALEAFATRGELP
jgi:hypothetical protein